MDLADFVCSQSYQDYRRVKASSFQFVLVLSWFNSSNIQKFGEDVDCFDLFCGKGAVGKAFRLGLIMPLLALLFFFGFCPFIPNSVRPRGLGEKGKCTWKPRAQINL